MEKNQNAFSCVIMGEQSLLIQCGEILLAEGHQIVAVVTDDPAIDRWSRQHALPVLAADAKNADLASELADHSFDYLFSITNLRLIPQEVLDLPRREAINFHDGPLPRYAGLNAPAWALMNREAEYGVSFHEMRGEVDEGGVYEQRLFEVSPDETSLTLNTKCFQAGIDAFGELVRKLASGTAQPVAQDLSARSYFGRFDRPSGAAFLDFRKPAAELEALVRALDFGERYENPLAVAKLACGDEVVVVRRAVADPDPDAETEAPAPGTVVAADAHRIVVATTSGDLWVTGLSELCGAPLTVEDFCARAGIAEGSRLAVPDDAAVVARDERAGVLARGESLWHRRLSRLDPVDLPYLQNRRLESDAPSYASRSVQLPEDLPRGTGSGADALVAAVAAYVGRLGGQERFHVAFRDASLVEAAKGAEAWVSATVPMLVRQPAEISRESFFEAMDQEIAGIRKRGPWQRDLVGRTPVLAQNPLAASGAVTAVAIEIEAGEPAVWTPGSELRFRVAPDASSLEIHFEEHALDGPGADALASHLEVFLASLAGAPGDAKISRLPLLAEEEQARVLRAWNDTASDYASDSCIHELIAAQADRTPDAIAAVFLDRSLNYRELDERANQLAHHLRGRGVGPDSLVGIYTDRSLEMLVSMLGVHKAGGAYVPLDPVYPADRIALMIEDSHAGVVITQSHLEAQLPAHDAEVVLVDGHWSQIAGHPTTCPDVAVSPSNLAYVIYTSGSTGRPKGVMVEHRNVANFFAGMDQRVAHDTPGVWLAVTSLSFDISVLELLWTLARGFQVVLYADDAKRGVEISSTPIDFGLFMWGADDAQGNAKYELMLESAKFGDRHGFSSFWTPERHFHSFGGPYPNPAVTGAAIAAITERIGIRAGSCVSPLHHPIRIAEEWAVVDNLSKGRIGISFAAGWQPNDFVLRPENHKDAKGQMFRDIEMVQKLWRGESVEFQNPLGAQVATTTQPRPIQAELPFWVTTAGNPETFRMAGESGGNLLTHLLGQTLEELKQKIDLYREGRKSAGLDPATGVVTLMLHTLVGDDDEAVKEVAREPMKQYLSSAANLLKGFAWAFPAFTRPGGDDELPEIDLASLEPEELDAILEFAFERYYETSGLFGSVDTCLAQVEKVKGIGVDEIGCLIDYGVPTDLMLESLELLDQVREQANALASGSAGAGDEGVDYSLPAQVARHRVTHMQCTPSMARMLVLDRDTHPALGQIQHLMVGGEAFPVSLAHELDGLAGGTVTNMYGPTETTIWSSTERVAGKPDSISIGSPIANTQLYILDANLQPVPVGVAGELVIGGDGVVRGYHERPDLTADRFVADPFSARADARMYRTGDLARWRPDGSVEFIGRMDHQVKIRGYRIELGEIEARLGEQPDIETCVALVREDTPGDQRLVAYASVAPEAAGKPEPEVLRAALGASLPEFMIPSAFCFLDAFPLTPNGKIDRKALPAPEQLAPHTSVAYQAPENELELTIATVWQQVLKLDTVGTQDNFFDLGGHSLLVVQVHRQLRDQIERPLSLTDLYRFPTIRTLVRHLSSEDDAGASAEAAADRGERRRAALSRRRKRGRG